MPDSSGSLSDLEHNQALRGTLPASLGSLASLSVLWLSNCRLGGSLPASLGSLGNLSSLCAHPLALPLATCG